MMFLARGWLTPTLPPTELSTWASRRGRHHQQGQAPRRRSRRRSRPGRRSRRRPGRRRTVWRSARRSHQLGRRGRRPGRATWSPRRAAATAAVVAIPTASSAGAGGPARATFSSVTSRARRQARPAQVASRAARANAPNPSLAADDADLVRARPSSTRTRMAGSARQRELSSWQRSRRSAHCVSFDQIFQALDPETRPSGSRNPT